MTADALAERSARAASGFKTLGIGAGDLIALCLRNDFAVFEASIAAGMLGAYPTPMNWHSSESEARYLLENSGARAVVVHADLAPRIRAAAPHGVGIFSVPTPPDIASAYGIPPAACAAPGDTLDWNAWLEAFPPLDGAPVESPGSIIYTSGTTGQPKGVRRFAPTPDQRARYAAIIEQGFGFSGAHGSPAEIVVAVTGPMYHSAPNAYGLTAARIGATVILEPRFDPEDLLSLIERERVTHLHMVPIMFNRLLQLPAGVRAQYDLSSLQFVVHAAAPCPVAVKRAMIDWWGPLIHEYYGATETGMIAFCDTAEWLRHPGSVGRVLPDSEVRILDADGRRVPAGGTGEIVARVRGVVDFTYHGDDAKRRAAEKDGLIAPGDVGYLDADGFLYLCDRAKDMIISGGVNIYPAEIEAVLQRMPGVVDCAVFGVPDEEFGEAVCAVVQPEPEARLEPADVEAFVRLHMAGYKAPRQVEFAAELPREDSGKIFKRKLRELYWAGLERRI